MTPISPEATGWSCTAEENELLAQQLETEKQATLDRERQRQEQERQRISQGPNPLTINALAQGNLRLGATSDVYAAAVAASENLQPGTLAYERLVQRISAEDQVRNLQGKNRGWEEQLNRDKLVQWFSHQQQQQATQQAEQSKQDQLHYWEAIAAGLPPPANNSFTGLFGTSPFTSFNTIPGQDNTGVQIRQLSTQIDLLQQQLLTLQQIAGNTSIINI